jgi:hypothetical protein
LLADRKPRLMVTDPPYAIELDSEWRDRAGLNGCGPAEASYMKHRTEGHTETSISGDTRADWSDAFALVPNLEVAYVWHASKFTRSCPGQRQCAGHTSTLLSHSQQTCVFGYTNPLQTLMQNIFCSASHQ